MAVEDITRQSNLVLGVGGRLSQSPSKTMVHTAFASELNDQLNLFKSLSLSDLAHCLVLDEIGVLERSEACSLTAALLELHELPDDFKPSPENGDLYTNREAWLSLHSDATGWLGAGRARREATTVAYHLTVRRLLLDMSHAMCKTIATLLSQAEASISTLIPDYTYLQAGQPTTFGHYLLTFAFPLLRDLERVTQHYARVNRSPAGCGSANGATLQLDRSRLSRLLGFERSVVHTRDAMWQADVPIETLAILTSAMITLDRLGEDLMIFCTDEFGYIELSDSCSRASKIMPQKKNPYALNIVRGLANQIIGVQTVTASMQRTPSGQIDNRLFVYGEVPRALQATIDALELMDKVLNGMEIKPDSMENRVKNGFVLATDLAEQVALDNHLDFRAAHRIIGCLVKEFARSGRVISELTQTDLELAASGISDKPVIYSDELFRIAQSPGAAIDRRCGLGGAAKKRINEMIEDCQKQLAGFQSWADTTLAGVTAFEAALLDAARSLVEASP